MIGGSMGEYTGACLHCGQIGTSDYMGFDSKERFGEAQQIFKGLRKGVKNSG